MSFKPFTIEVPIDPALMPVLDRADIYLSPCPGKPDVVRVSVVPAGERWLIDDGSTGKRRPGVYWLPMPESGHAS